MRLHHRRFLLANAIGAAAWAGAITLLGGLLGTAAQSWVSGVGWVLLAVVVVVALLVSRRLHRMFEERVAQFSDESRG
ncbi:hypothetical protein [Aestuariimicrobium ganziense]|uniref:hypothetical protein n=1 Tax=Aestuariimicrobium ganziense TaxID=2773677 RepID=UPI00194322E8|nr:hypothetical protein [Aestuariimicrobium ganziense]